MMQPRSDVEMLPDIEIEPAMAQKVRDMTEIADSDLEEVRVNLRWRRQHLHTVKRAAALMGVPYQTYLKHVVLRQALADLRQGAAQ